MEIHKCGILLLIEFPRIALPISVLGRNGIFTRLMTLLSKCVLARGCLLIHGIFPGDLALTSEIVVFVIALKVSRIVCARPSLSLPGRATNG